jgi:hypothetical protein
MDPAPSPARLHVDLQRMPEEVFEPDAVPEAPLVRFAAYARHHRVSGWVHLRADRLTDLLNTHDELLLTDVEVEGLEDGETHAVDRVLITRADLVAVHAAGPRGDAALRVRTRAHPLAMQAGNYLIGGHLHAIPGVDPLDHVRDRPPMIPLTDAWIEYWSAERRTRQAIGTLIVNRVAADWVRVVTDEDLVDGTLRPTPLPGLGTA